MTRRSLLPLVLALVALRPVAAQAQAPNEVDRLRWMAGCWELRSSSRVTHEQWMAPLGGVMLGMSRTVARDVVRESEMLRIERVNGTVTYLAQPAGQPVTPFAATIVSDTLVIFANPAHDFPQRIIYRSAAGGDSLIARIEGDRGDAVQGMNFPMRRSSCGGPEGGG